MSTKLSLNNKYLEDKEWHVEESDEGYIIHIKHKGKDFSSKMLKKRTIELLGHDESAKQDMFDMVVNSIKARIQRHENIEKAKELLWQKEKYNYGFYDDEDD